MCVCVCCLPRESTHEHAYYTRLSTPLERASNFCFSELLTLPNSYSCGRMWVVVAPGLRGGGAFNASAVKTVRAHSSKTGEAGT